MKELKRMYEAAEISKHEYIDLCYDLYHRLLHDYSEYLIDCDISGIEILDKKIIVTTRRDGLRFICPLGDKRVVGIETLNFEVYEEEETREVCRLVKDGSTILDVGGNMGWYSILLASKFPNCEVHTFEPLPMTYDVLLQNIELNMLKNITCNNFGISDQIGEFTFYFNANGSGNASQRNLSEADNTESLVCSVSTIDTYVQTLGLEPAFIKIDIEGGELLALRGAAETIKSCRPTIFCEILRKWCRAFEYDPSDIFSLMRHHGYTCKAVTPTGMVDFVEMSEDTLETNFFFYPDN